MCRGFDWRDGHLGGVTALGTLGRGALSNSLVWAGITAGVVGAWIGARLECTLGRLPRVAGAVYAPPLSPGNVESVPRSESLPSALVPTIILGPRSRRGIRADFADLVPQNRVFFNKILFGN